MLTRVEQKSKTDRTVSQLCHRCSLQTNEQTDRHQRNKTSMADTDLNSVCLGIQKVGVTCDRLKCDRRVLSLICILFTGEAQLDNQRGLWLQLCRQLHHRKMKMSGSQENEFTCSDGQCVRMDQRCNQLPNCRDKAEEKNYNILVFTGPRYTWGPIYGS